MKPIVITIIGKDQPGLVDKLAKCVYAHQGNWLASSFAQMAGQFVGFVEVHVPEAAHTTLIDSLNALDAIHVQSVTSTTDTPLSAAQSMQIDVMGNDRKGIVQDITAVLNQFNMNIRTMESRCESAPNWGNLMFKATVVIDVPDNFDTERLIQALEDIANDLVVDIASLV